jgi:hypothetical protein
MFMPSRASRRPFASPGRVLMDDDVWATAQLVTLSRKIFGGGTHSPPLIPACGT